MRRRAPGSSTLLALLVSTALPASSAAVAPTLLAQDRGLYAAPRAIEPGDSALPTSPEEAADFGPFSAAVSPSATTSAADAEASATLDSTLGPDQLVARGTTASQATTLAADARAAAPADSFFEVEFRAEATEPFSIAGLLEAEVDAGQAFASVELLDVATATALSSLEVAPGEPQSFSEAGTLQAGATYRLTVFALSFAEVGPLPGSSRGEARYDVALTIPEPDVAAGLGVAAGALSILASCGRGRGVRRARP